MTKQRVNTIKAQLMSVEAEAMGRSDYGRVSNVDFLLKLMGKESYENPFLYGLAFESFKQAIRNLAGT